LKLSDRPAQRRSVLTTRQADTLVLLDPNSGEYYSLNEVGARVWDLCDGSRTVADVVAAICGEFDCSPETVQDDVLHILDELVADRLVVVA